MSSGLSSWLQQQLLIWNEDYSQSLGVHADEGHTVHDLWPGGVPAQELSCDFGYICVNALLVFKYITFTTFSPFWVFESQKQTFGNTRVATFPFSDSSRSCHMTLSFQKKINNISCLYQQCTWIVMWYAFSGVLGCTEITVFLIWC